MCIKKRKYFSIFVKYIDLKLCLENSCIRGYFKKWR